MTTISGTLNFNAGTTVDTIQNDVLAEINKQLATQGKGAIHDPSLITISQTTGENGAITVSYQYTLDTPKVTDANAQKQAYESVMNMNLTDIFQLMALFHEVMKEQRETSNTVRQAELGIQVQSIEDQASKIRDAATSALVGAIVMGVVGIIGGMVSIGGAIKAASQTQQGMQTANQAKSLTTDANALSKQATDISQNMQIAKDAPKHVLSGAKLESQSLNQQAANLQQQAASVTQQSANLNQASAATLGKFQGWSSLLSSAGSTGKGISDFVAAGQQADGKKLEADATKAAAQRDEMTQYWQQMLQNMTEVRQLLSQISQADAEAKKSIIRA